MKKILFILLVLVVLAPASAFSTEIESVTGLDVQLSQGVSGYYFDDTTATPTAYQISTGHTQGTRAFASGSAESKIYYKDNAATSGAFASSDLLQSYSASALLSGTTWTEM